MHPWPRRTAVASWLVVLAWVGSLAGGGDEPLPYDVSVRVEFDEGAESPEMVDLIRFFLRDEVDSRRCMRSVTVLEEDEAPRTDLLARVRLSNLEEENEHLTSIAQEIQNPDPMARQQYVARFEVDVRVELIAVPTRRVIRDTRFHQAVSRQPRTLIEDANLAVRQEAVAEIVRETRRRICGSPKKLDKRIQQALAEPTAD